MKAESPETGSCSATLKPNNIYKLQRLNACCQLLTSVLVLCEVTFIAFAVWQLDEKLRLPSGLSQGSAVVCIERRAMATLKVKSPAGLEIQTSNFPAKTFFW